MHKVNVSVPAVSTNVGPGYDALGLALNLRNVIEMYLPNDDQLVVEMRGEGHDVLPGDVRHPIMRAAIRLFQSLEQAPAGLHVRCAGQIPLDVGLSARATMVVGGLVGANNLIGSPYTHEDLIHMAAEISGQPEAVVTAMRGGLGICSTGEDGLFYRALEITPLRVVLAVPILEQYTPRLRDSLPETVTMTDAVYNLGRSMLLVEALRSGDFDLLRHAVQDRLHEPHRRHYIPAFDAVAAAAEQAGALAVTLCGAGPALIAFAEGQHQRIESAIVTTFKAAGVEARTWALGVDMQGVVISVVE
ncbi:MAG: homoserine kinase [Anaerolineae bacterium]|nr:homoserine kinase [Anaerolineae bacterium]